MRKRKLMVTLFVAFNVMFLKAQETCENQEPEFDLNSITKCTVDKKEETSSSGRKTKKLSVNVSSSVRYLKKRKANEQVSSLGTMNTSGVESIKSNTDVVGDITTITSTKSNVSNIQKLKEKLSKEQLENSFEFENVDVIPAFKKCEFIKSSQQMSCFNEQMIAHIQKHFNYPQEAVLKKIQGNVWVRFVIDEDGSVTNLKTLAPKNGALLKEEAERVVSKLPSFVPAKKDKKNVLVKYGFPINFSLQE